MHKGAIATRCAKPSAAENKMDDVLVNEIIILEDDDGELAIVVSMNAPFSDYGEVFDENGNMKLRHNGNYKEISLQEVSA